MSVVEAPPGDKPPLGWSASRRLAVVLSAVLACLLTAGLAFGFSAIYPVLIRLGAFHDLCHDDGVGSEHCSAQVHALTGMFTLATSMLNVAALPTGAFLDTCGPSLTAGAASLATALGCVLFGSGGDGAVGHAAYTVGFLLLGVSGPALFNSTLSFSNLFPKRRGVVCAALVGCFDASSAVFVALAALIRQGVPFDVVFLAYALVPLAASAVAFTLWPKQPVPSASNESSHGNRAATPLWCRARNLQHLKLRAQFRAPEFALLGLTVCVTMVCINFFIATVFAQMSEVNPELALHLTQVFAVMLPLGGIVYMPVIGPLVDAVGPASGYAVLWLLYAYFQVCLLVFRATGLTFAAYVAFAVFALIRPLFYTLGASFTGQVFGFETFGTVYGAINTAAGFANLFVQPLGILGGEHGFEAANLIVWGFHFATASLPVYACVTSRRQPNLDPEGLLNEAHSDDEGGALMARGRTLSSRSF